MADDAFRWSFIGFTTLAVIFIILAIAGFISTWIIAVVADGGVAFSCILLNYLGKEYTGC